MADAALDGFSRAARGDERFAFFDAPHRDVGDESGSIVAQRSAAPGSLEFR